MSNMTEPIPVAVRKSDGSIVKPGDELTSFRGETYTYERAIFSRGTGRVVVKGTGRVAVKDSDGDLCWYFPSVFPELVSEIMDESDVNAKKS